MKALRRFLNRVASWINPHRDEERLSSEIQAHLDLQAADNIRSGLSIAEARRLAVLKFGAVEAIREDYRDRRSLPFLETLIQDTRYALRRLRKSPAFTITTVLTLALGIGATTSIFTLAHAVLLRSLAVSNPSDLYRLGRETHCCVWGGYTQFREFSIVSDALYQHFRDNTKGFAELAAFEAGDGSLFAIRPANSADPVRSFPGKFVSGNYFAMFGVNAILGRTLVPRDDLPDAPPVLVMSYRLWRQQFGSDASVIGSVFTLNGKSFTVVGIDPPGFYGDTLSATPPRFLSASFDGTDGARRKLFSSNSRRALAGFNRTPSPGCDRRFHRSSNASGTSPMDTLPLG